MTLFNKDLEAIIDNERYIIVWARDKKVNHPFSKVDTQEKLFYIYNTWERGRAEDMIRKAQYMYGRNYDRK